MSDDPSCWRISNGFNEITLAITLNDLFLPDDVFYERYFKPALVALRSDIGQRLQQHAMDPGRRTET